MTFTPDTQALVSSVIGILALVFITLLFCDRMGQFLRFGFSRGG